MHASFFSLFTADIKPDLSQSEFFFCIDFTSVVFSFFLPDEYRYYNISNMSKTTLYLYEILQKNTRNL